MGYFEESLAIHSALDRVETYPDFTSIESNQNSLDGWVSTVEDTRKGFSGKVGRSGNNRKSEIISGPNRRSSMKTNSIRGLLLGNSWDAPGAPLTVTQLFRLSSSFFSPTCKYSQGCPLVVSDPEF